MIKKLLDFILLSNGITPANAEQEQEDKWAKIRAEREAWEHQRDLERAAPPERTPASDARDEA